MKALWILLAVCVGLAALLAFPVAHAGDDDRESLVGTWRLTVSDPGGGFLSLTTFNADNTLIDRPSTSTTVGLGVGVWKAICDDDDDHSDRPGRGNEHRHCDPSEYAATFDSFIDSDFDTNFDIRARIRLTVYVENDTLTGTGTIEILSLDGSQLLDGPFPGATIVATRMTVIPE
jgi:hypothetical protein